MSVIARLVSVVGFVASSACPLAAQCAGWEPTFGALGADYHVYALAVHDDGSGSALYAGGAYTGIGGVAAEDVARYDGTGWTPLPPIDGVPYALLSFDDGSGPALYAAVRHWNAAIPLFDTYVTRWDGTAWSQVGPTFPDSFPGDLAVYDDGAGAKLHYAVRSTAGAGGTVQRFDGASWNVIALFHDPGEGYATELEVFDDGSGPALYAGGRFRRVRGTGTTVVNASGLARWNGGPDWTPVGSFANPGSPHEAGVFALYGHDDGSGPALYVGGMFGTVGDTLGVPARNIARFAGGVWTALADGLGVPGHLVHDMVTFDDGTGPALYVGGTFSTGAGSTLNSVARWDGATWSDLDGGISGTVARFALFDDGADGDLDLYVGGPFTGAGGRPAGNVARWTSCVTEAFCAGDGSGVACPCSNSGAAGHGCENSASTGGAKLIGTGGSHPDQMLLSASGVVPNVLAIFLQGDVDIAAVPFGDGLRCVGGNLTRLFVVQAVGDVVSAPQPGDPSITARSTALGDPIAPGSPRSYQTYYRDPSQGFCSTGSTYNMSNALRVVW